MRIGCEMIARSTESAIYHLISNNCCLLKTIKKLCNLLDLADFTLQEQPEDNLMVAISWAMANQIPGIALYNDQFFNNSGYLLSYSTKQLG